MRAYRPSSRNFSNWWWALNTSVGHAKRRVKRELAECNPTTKKVLLAKLKAKSESSGSELTEEFQRWCRRSSSCSRWSCAQSSLSKPFSPTRAWRFRTPASRPPTSV